MLLETARLELRRLALEDAPFILRLVNDPAWLRFIGDKGVRNLDDAREYLRKGPLESYARLGLGLYRVTLKDGTPAGICGLLKRDSLPEVDIGFAFLAEFCGRGYASESAAAVMAHGARDFGLRRILAITTPDNAGSIRVLEKLGMRFERRLQLAPGTEELSLYCTLGGTKT